jgi:hypothetical protein
MNLVIPGRAKREPGIHNHRGALGPWAIRAKEKRPGVASLFFRECGKPQARCGYGFRARASKSAAADLDSHIAELG